MTAANGLTIPYLGYVELTLAINDLVIPNAGFLVVKNDCTSISKKTSKVPGIIGCNVINKLTQKSE